MAHRARHTRQLGETRHTTRITAHNDPRTMQPLGGSSDPGHTKINSGSRTNPSFHSNLLTQFLSPDLLDHITSLEAENRDLRADNQQLQHVLDDKEKEVAGLREVLCMYDDCSEVELGNMINNINTRIESLTRNVSRNWISVASRISAPREGGDNPQIPEEERALVQEIIGSQLISGLAAVKPGISRGAPLFLQYAWKAVIIKVVTKVLQCFSPVVESSTEHHGLDATFRKIGAEVMVNEVQPAYGHWRMVTHRSLRAVVSGEEQAIRAYAGEALTHCQTVCRIMLGNRGPSDETFVKAFQDELELIFKDTFKLLTNVQENMITTNYEPFRPLSGNPFDGTIMGLTKDDEEYPDDRVVCTVGIGMLCWTKESQEQKIERLPRKLFRKPEVLTEKNLNALFSL